MTGEVEQYQRYKAAIARIYRSWDGAVVGSGFLVFNGHVLTCAHVVADALGIPRNFQHCPEDLIELDFPFPVGEKKQKFKAKAKVNSMIFSPDGKTLFSGSEDKTIKVWRNE